MGFLGNPALVLVTQHDLPAANYVMSSDPTSSINPVRVPSTWLNILTGKIWVCTDNTEDANVWVAQRPPFSGALVTSTAGQSIPNGSWTAVNMETETYDTDGFHEGVTNPSRLTIPSGVSRVKLTWNLDFSNNGSGTYRASVLYKNGASVSGSQQPSKTVTGAVVGYPTQGTTSVLEVSEGDYFQLMCAQDSGGNLALTTGANRVWLAIEVVE